MITAIIPLCLASLAAASPLAPRVNIYPTTEKSLAFQLVANVSDPSAAQGNFEFHHWLVSGVHTGAGQEAMVLDPNDGFIFWENGTEAAIKYGPVSLQTDMGQNPGGFILGDADEAGVQNAGVNFGPGSLGVGIRTHPEPHPFVFAPTAGTFVACNQAAPLPQYAVKFVQGYGAPIHEKCVAIRLLAQCANLQPIEVGSKISHAFVRTQNCYKDVAAIDWSQYMSAGL